MKVAIIGLGKVGFLWSLDKLRNLLCSHVACYDSLPEVSDIAMCDIDKEKVDTVRLHYIAQEALPKPKYHFYIDYLEMMKEFQPDIVSIATPTPTHKQIACDVVANPCVKAIFLEKPIAQSIADAEYIINKCTAEGVRLVVDYSRRWSHTYEVAKKMSLYNIGRVFLMVGHHHGPLLRTGSHMVDLFNYFAKLGLQHSSVIEVQAFGRPENNYLKPSDDYNIHGVLKYDNGVEAILISGKQKSYLMFELDIFGEKGRIRITQNGDITEIWQSDQSTRYENIQELQFRSIFRSEPENPLLEAIKEVIEIAESEKKIELNKNTPKPPNEPKMYYGHMVPQCSGEDALRALHYCLAIHYSAMHNNEIVKPEQVPKDYEVKTY